MPDELDKLRAQLDVIDREVIALLAQRFEVTEAVGHYKKQHNLPPVDPAREAKQFERIAELAKEAGLDPLFAQSMLRLTIDEVVKRHKEIQAGH